MTSRSWRGVQEAVNTRKWQELQWGHDLTVMERVDPRAGSALREWLQWGHDLTVMERVSERLSLAQFRHRRSKVLGQALKSLAQYLTKGKHSTLHPASTAVVNQKPASGPLYGGSPPDRSQLDFVRLFACEP